LGNAKKARLINQRSIQWKASINVDGSKQQEGIDYGDTFAPVASWSSIRVVLLIAAMNKWETKQLDFVHAFPQAPIEKELYISIPKGCEVIGDSKEWALKVVNNIYGQKQAGKVRFDFLTHGLINKFNFKKEQQ
jgi:Reverse transcriptase (RNA-dependent DNA polymerase)